ncbi:hypothetical protein [Polymorphobacter fuscus]|uniref:EF-hand domain-containing protein n=1 Tax=Sandarakinorhabdus fusca TaxID=1439888 RepID=A0A7C9LF68_9SPHN|nr:hypothetical protein [Polymorphobacter fuscus]KAB7648900.1 hypothetical protein F9290_04345 [Polymorphobacter fuscus]MQT16487.1 hypothetical protein [Polymorphobacter fuscus]NJC07223.1 hypothetical protein [Polymorphobacter fuscus]
MRLFLSAILAATAINAQAAPAAPAASDAQARLVAADANKDGKWDKAEWRAAGRRDMGFAFCDVDKDSVVDAAELKSCAEKARAMGMTAQ